jgi:hypothetical protein
MKSPKREAEIPHRHDEVQKFLAPFTDFTIFSLVAVFAIADVRPDAGAVILARRHADRPALIGLGIQLVVLAAMRHFPANRRAREKER